tara:strand:+ start:789 stop:1853 length:1065 start_codon:yes stop_codon:yes gene_type:complete
MATKTISVNPDFFNVGGRKKTRKKLSHSLRTNFNSLQKNALKNKMIDRIKEFKKKRKKKSSPNNDVKFEDDYNSAMDFMEEIIKKKKTKKNKKKRKDREREEQRIKINTNELTNNNVQTAIKPTIQPIIKPIIQPMRQTIIKPAAQQTISVVQPETNIKNDPPYGILKNGSKPLYSKYRKSLKTTQNINPLKQVPQSKERNIPVFTDEKKFGTHQTTPPNVSIRKSKLENMKQNYINKHKKKKDKNEKFKVKNKKVIKRFILGKNSKTRKVAVLIKNKKTRRLINRDCNFLKKKKLKQVKSVLVKNALIKVGTQAPEKLLREMYVNRHLAGDIQNSGGKNAEEILMHNWGSESR